MTIQVELLNKDQFRDVVVEYRDATMNQDGQPDGSFSVCPAGYIKSGQSATFWIHSTRELLVSEANIVVDGENDDAQRVR